ncbi:type I-E CRISPR-associated protein Cas7/Cse4/CasC [Kocuria rhizophila]|uniref:type I-E CRISPR-associated protein Cas7/Cse4/CasC n=1 Tax=Kocuria rhizophila TaxID=72000 RepID=UPI002ED0EA19|nr:type I-E CRISPR-associated protein Cas7/Cse4/CasC [Kocuria rhizophila]
MTTYIDFHALQTLAPNNINRGEDGAPKTAFFGGVQRQRISSQALKAAQRRSFGDYLDRSELGTRTKRVVELVAQSMVELDATADYDDALKLAEAAFKKAGINVSAPKAKKSHTEPKAPAAGYLVFLGHHQVDRLARVLLERGEAGLATKKEAQELLDTEHAVDVALFGRMVAEDATLNVDAAVQVAHALGTHAAVPDFDYYTAIDEMERLNEQTGAGMIGTLEMMSSTVYRYATLNVDQLVANLGSVDAAVRAAEAFAATFIESLPSGKQNTFAAHSLPELVSVAVRDRRPVSYVNAFEKPVEVDEGGNRRVAATTALASEAQGVEDTYGMSPLHAWVMAVPALRESAEGLGESVNQKRLVEAVGEAVREAAGTAAEAAR